MVIFRVLILALLAGGVAGSAVLRRRADRAGGSVSRSVDPVTVRAALAAGGLLFYGSLLAWIVRPPFVAWAGISLADGWRWLGVVLVAAGVGLALWTLRHLGLATTPTAAARPDAELVTSGPYRLVRHPLYASMLQTVPRGALASANFLVLAGGVVTVSALLWRTRWEERALLGRFGARYRSYMERTGRLLPRLRPGGGASAPAIDGAPPPERGGSVPHSVRRHLRLDVDDYDATIRRFIPGYETMLEVAAEAVASVRPTRVVDLGAGTGGLSEAILEREGIGLVELLDVDPEMMERARARLDRFDERVRFTLRSYDEPFEPADAFAASLSLHHIPTLGAKATLFERVHAALRPGGTLVNADVNMPNDEGERDALYRHWAAHLVASGIPEERAWAHFEEWAEEDTYLPLDDELAALRRIGFMAQRVWSDGPVGVVVARKR